MSRIYIALIEIMAAAVFIVPIWCIYNKFCFHSRKRTIIYMIFGFYLTAVLALVGFPNIISLKVELTVNIIPFVYMIDDNYYPFSFRITSCAPPSVMLVDETMVILAFCCNSGILTAPQLHMVALILPRVTARLSFILPA